MLAKLQPHYLSSLTTMSHKQNTYETVLRDLHWHRPTIISYKRHYRNTTIGCNWLELLIVQLNALIWMVVQAFWKAELASHSSLRSQRI